jgi:hypothetical protein
MVPQVSIQIDRAYADLAVRGLTPIKNGRRIAARGDLVAWVDFSQ